MPDDNQVGAISFNQPNGGINLNPPAATNGGISFNEAPPATPVNNSGINFANDATGGIQFSTPPAGEKPLHNEPNFSTPVSSESSPATPSAGISFSAPQVAAPTFNSPPAAANGVNFTPTAAPAISFSEPAATPKEPAPIVVDQKSGEIPVQLPRGSGEIAIEALLGYVRANYGSDLHISSNSTPKIRLYGEVYPIPGWQPLSEDETLRLIHQTMDGGLQEVFAAEQDIDYSFCDDKNQRYRCNALQTLRGPAAVFRIIADKIFAFDELGLPESVRMVQHLKKGLVLVTGPAGCGKSTTMATLIDMVNDADEGHILTIEDPVEILHKSKKSLVNHREVKTHTKSFARALKSALREDPDCIMIGEMRDLETISLALTAAETGHLVFGTLHTSSAHKTITRIIDAFPAGEQGQVRTMIAESVQCVISQVLCRRKDGQGRIAAFEVMLGSAAIRNLIRQDKIFQIPSAIEIGVKEGMQSLDQSLGKLVRANLIDLEEAKSFANHPEDLG